MLSKLVVREGMFQEWDEMMEDVYFFRNEKDGGNVARNLVCR